ncbi:MAG: kelch repeat-containing protein [Terriglobales bacterium]
MNCTREHIEILRRAALLTLFVLTAGATLPLEAQTDSAEKAVSAVTHNTWTSGTPLPTPVVFATSAVLENEIYVVDGSDSTGIVSDVQVYNPVAKTWSTGSSYPTGIESASAAVVKNILYVFGGTPDGMTPSNAVWAYSPKTKTWTAKADMPTARWATAAVVEKNIIYVIGGVVNASGNGVIATVESYNPATNTWTEEAPMLVAKGQPAAGLLGTALTGYTIVVADGATNGQGDTGDNEGYDATTNTWTSLATDPASRYASCSGSVGAKFYDMGGDTASTFADDFQLSKDKWTTTLASVPQSTIFPASAVYKGQLYCIGGWASWEGTIIDNVQIYQP